MTTPTNEPQLPCRTAIGIDPGPVPGLVVVRPDSTHEVVQCSAGLLDVVLRALVATASRAHDGPCGCEACEVRAVVIGVERYVVGRRSGRSSTPGAGQITRDQVGAVQSLAAELGVPCRARPAADVMPWASDARLRASGLWAATEGMRHARAAARHAIFTAHADCGAPDPLSRRSRS